MITLHVGLLLTKCLQTNRQAFILPQEVAATKPGQITIYITVGCPFKLAQNVCFHLRQARLFHRLAQGWQQHEKPHRST